MKTSSRVSRLAVALGLAFAPAIPATAAAGQSTAATPNPSTAMFDAPSGYSYKILAPEGREFLKCRFLRPDDFKLVDVPQEEIDFSQSKNFMPLVVTMANYAFAVAAIGARPAYEDGNVSSWLQYFCKAEGYEAGPMEVIKVGPLDAIACDAIQISDDGGRVQMRMILLEDGGRFYQLSAMAPEPIWRSFAPIFEKMLLSFEVETRRGQTMPLTPEAEAATRVKASEGEAQSSNVSARLSAKEFAELVFADDMSALDPENKINANLRERGIGFVPNVLSVDREEKSARVGAGAIEGVFRVPFGWHVNDDGRRTLVFDAAGRMQISLNLRRRELDSLQELGQSYIAEYLEEQPGIKPVTVEFGGIVAVGVRGLKVDDEVLDQVFLLRDIGRDGHVLVARVTGNTKDVGLAMNLAGDIITSVEAELAVLK